MPRMRWRPGLRPGPRWGNSRRSPDPLVGWGGDTPSPRTPLPRRLDPRAFSARFCSASFLAYTGTHLDF